MGAQTSALYAIVLDFSPGGDWPSCHTLDGWLKEEEEEEPAQNIKPTAKFCRRLNNRHDVASMSCRWHLQCYVHDR